MTRFALALAAVIFTGTAVAAHHGYSAFFDPADRTIELTGVIERISYAEPHVVIRLRVDNRVLYTVTWGGPSHLQRGEAFNPLISRDTFKRGDRLVVIGAPAIDPDVLEVTLIQEVRRPSDGLVWRHPNRFIARPD
jgi:hypothetical protein